MKILLSSIAVILVGVLCLWLFFSFKATPATETPAPSSTVPVASNQTWPQGPLPDQSAAAGTQPELAQAFVGQLEQNANLISVKETSIASTYALQVWGDQHAGGEALLSYTPTDGWRLVSMGGGAWSVEGLVAKGVPQTIAEKLIADRDWHK